jgi:homoserine kinase type II
MPSSRKTKFLKADYQKIIFNYDIGDYLKSTNFVNGTVNTTVLIKTTQSNFVLRYYENRKKRHVQFEVDLMNYLKSKSFLCPKVIKDKNGNFINSYQNKPYIIIEYVDGRHFKNPNYFNNIEFLKQFSKIVARFHKLSRQYKIKDPYGHEEFNVKYCWNKFQNNPHYHRTKDSRQTWFKQEINKINIPKNLPKGVCHCDLNYSNVLMKKNKIVSLLDFDMACYTYLVYDIASLIYWEAWPPKKGYNVQKTQTIVKEYNKIRNLNNNERNHIYDFLKLIILLGIGWSEEDDFQQEKSKIEYLNNLGRRGFINSLW